ncbi:MAG: hypothetical protein H0X64_08550 [Gemmatimonadaceae bacterium]|nr:hypothetical protein [Gemmatimonadaceae bacterium]
MQKILLALILISSPAALAAQSVSLAGAVRSNALAPEQPRLSAAAWARIDARIASAAERGVPAAPMRSRAADGEARLASESRIHSILESTETDLRTAQRTFARQSRWASEAEIISAADALGYGASEAQVASVVRRAPADRPLVVALTTLAAMVGRGDSPERATGVVEGQLAAGASDASIAASAGGSRRAP